MSKWALVSGASSGIGREAAILLSKNGWNLILLYRNESSILNTIKEMDSTGILKFEVDITDESQIIALFQSLKTEKVKLNAIINCAGVACFSSISDSSSEDFHRVFNTNTFGTFLLCKYGSKLLSEGSGSIVNISTGMTHSSSYGLGIYVASKLAIEGLTKTLAKELGPRGIRVNTVSPGMTNTPMLSGGDTDTLVKTGAKSSVFNRIGEPSDIADIILYLISRESAWITGNNIQAGGGSVIY